MIKFVHGVRGTVWVIPDEGLWLVELSVFKKLLGLWVGGVREDRLKIVVLDWRIRGVFHYFRNNFIKL
jgi:hypothetical protein